MEQKEIFPIVLKKIQKMKLGKSIIKYQKYLLENGYTKSTIYHYIGDIKRYMNGISSETINIHIRTIDNNFRIRKCSKSILKRFYNYMSGRTQNKTKYKLPEIVRKYFDFCLIHCNLKKPTLSTYETFILDFLKYVDLESVNIFSIDRFIYKHTDRMSRGSINVLCAALRSFLRFLYLCGYIKKDLSTAVIHPKIYSKKLIPKHINQDEIKLILDNVDTSTVRGKRDYAILLLLVNYGLRPKEIAYLRLGDIDFNNNKIYIRERKSGDDLILPLTEEIKEAIFCYIKARCNNRDEIFLMSNAPHRQMSGAKISDMVNQYINRTSIRLDRKGAYIFRHSLAKHLLEQGVDIVSIGSILGHKCISSTMQYLRVNVESLREITDNYANLL